MLSNCKAVIKQAVFGTERNSLNQLIPTYQAVYPNPVNAWLTQASSQVSQKQQESRYDYELSFIAPKGIDVDIDIGWTVEINETTYTVVNVEPAYVPAGKHHIILGISAKD